jgi:uncharacterized protein (DUF2235 family)
MAKKIVLLADGTGNAFTTQESNIWRIFQALDSSDPSQVACYIEGVGTSSFRPWAIFDGATGIGVPDNVLKLYRFLSWHWEPGSEIYMFGFSRGAFTIRTLIDLVANEGLLPVTTPTNPGGAQRPVTHKEMNDNSKAAWRNYCRKDTSRNTNLWVMLGARVLRDAVLRLMGKPEPLELAKAIMAQGRAGPNIQITFAGLFDTVEAYGVPIEELRKAVHFLILPIEFGNNYQISPRVKWVRHALSLDDERTTFHPIRIAQPASTPGGVAPSSDRIEEVWFCGVHSDVGGGYPDDAVAHVPLVWMLEEVQRLTSSPQQQGLILKNGALNDFQAKASTFDPLHDSRAGLSTLYRYDPRFAACATNAMFGQTIVHHSVVERIAFGRDDYAPVILPNVAAVYMPDGALYTAFPTQWAPIRPAFSSPHPFAQQRMTQALAAFGQLATPLDQPTLNMAWDYVWRRRVNYFVLVALLLTLLSLPLIGDALQDILEAPLKVLPQSGSNDVEDQSGATVHTPSL